MKTAKKKTIGLIKKNNNNNFENKRLWQAYTDSPRELR